MATRLFVMGKRLVSQSRFACLLGRYGQTATERDKAAVSIEVGGQVLMSGGNSGGTQREREP